MRLNKRALYQSCCGHEPQREKELRVQSPVDKSCCWNKEQRGQSLWARAAAGQEQGMAKDQLCFYYQKARKWHIVS